MSKSPFIVTLLSPSAGVETTDYVTFSSADAHGWPDIDEATALAGRFLNLDGADVEIRTTSRTKHVSVHIVHVCPADSDGGADPGSDHGAFAAVLSIFRHY